MAKKKGVQGWHSMRKEQLIRALVKLSKKKPSAKAKNGVASKKPISTTDQKRESAIARKIREDRVRRENLKDLALANSFKNKTAEPEKDRIALVVRDSYWIQAYWEITKTSVRRAKAALAESWHNAKPVLRVLEVSDETVNGAEDIVREIEIHGGVRNWYIDVPEPPKSYRVALGYVVNGRFHQIVRSNQVTTPIPGRSSIDENWTDITEDYEKYYAMSGGYESQHNGGSELQAVFEDKIRRPIQQPAFVRLGTGIHGSGMREFDFEVDAHMVIYGATDPSASVTLGGEPVKLENDGTFSVHMNLPDRRQVLPVVASSRDGTEQRTTVLAIERNTKIMEPVTRDVELN